MPVSVHPSVRGSHSPRAASNTTEAPAGAFPDAPYEDGGTCSRLSVACMMLRHGSAAVSDPEPPRGT